MASAERFEVIELVVIASRDTRKLRGVLHVPSETDCLVVIAPGGGGNRFRKHNQDLGRTLQLSGCGTLLIDLLEDDESSEPARIYDSELLASRLADVLSWAAGNQDTHGLPLGLMASGTAAAAALVTTARRVFPVGAVVSTGGRPDLAMEYLFDVASPSLFIARQEDSEVLAVNRECFGLLRCRKALQVVTGFAEEAIHARDWFRAHLLNAPDTAARTASHRASGRPSYSGP